MMRADWRPGSRGDFSSTAASTTTASHRSPLVRSEEGRLVIACCASAISPCRGLCREPKGSSGTRTGKLRGAASPNADVEAVLVSFPKLCTVPGRSKRSRRAGNDSARKSAWTHPGAGRGGAIQTRADREGRYADGEASCTGHHPQGRGSWKGAVDSGVAVGELPQIERLQRFPRSTIGGRAAGARKLEADHSLDLGCYCVNVKAAGLGGRARSESSWPPAVAGPTGIDAGSPAPSSSRMRFWLSSTAEFDYRLERLYGRANRYNRGRARRRRAFSVATVAHVDSERHPDRRRGNVDRLHCSRLANIRRGDPWRGRAGSSDGRKRWAGKRTISALYRAAEAGSAVKRQGPSGAERRSRRDGKVTAAHGRLGGRASSKERTLGLGRSQRRAIAVLERRARAARRSLSSADLARRR